MTIIGLGAFALSGCSAGNPTSAPTTTTSSAPASTTTAPPGSASTTSTTSSTPQNLVASAALKSALTAAYVAHNHLPTGEVAGTAPGSVYYAYVPPTNTYWAIAGFVPTPGAGTQTQVAMQDEGCCGAFSQLAGGAWTYVAGFLGAPCPGQIPAELESLWQLTYPSGCPATTTTTSAG